MTHVSTQVLVEQYPQLLSHDEYVSDVIIISNLFAPVHSDLGSHVLVAEKQANALIRSEDMMLFLIFTIAFPLDNLLQEMILQTEWQLLMRGTVFGAAVAQKVSEQNQTFMLT